MSSPDISVIVPVRNGEHQLPHLLGALAKQTLPRDRFELLVVDDCSTDGTVELLRASGLATVLSTPRRGGSYVARNVAGRAARGSIMAFTDGDCVPAPDWLERGLERMRAGTADLLAGHVHLPLGPRPSAAALLDASRHLDQQRAVADGFGATANLWLPARVFSQTGMFNEKLISGGDTEFCHRAVAGGARLAYAPDVVVMHPVRDRRGDMARKTYRLGYGAAQQRHHAEGVLRDRVHICRRPGAYIPHRTIAGLDRLDRLGRELTWEERVRMHVVQYLYLQLPMVAGNLRGTLDERRRARAPREVPSEDALAPAQRAA
jgi:glycosyltransferase involved in cell wall biosynthesis